MVASAVTFFGTVFIVFSDIYMFAGFGETISANLRYYYVYLFLHKRRKQPQNFLKQFRCRIFRTVLFLNLLTGRKCVHKILFYLHHSTAAVHPGTALEVKVQASEIQVCCTDGGNQIVTDKGFCVNESAGVFVDLYTGPDQFPVIRAGGHVY